MPAPDPGSPRWNQGKREHVETLMTSENNANANNANNNNNLVLQCDITRHVH